MATILGRFYLFLLYVLHFCLMNSDMMWLGAQLSIMHYFILESYKLPPSTRQGLCPALCLG